jgi:hypothetical protein
MGGPTNLIVAIGQCMLDESRVSVQDHFRLPNDRQIFHSPTLHFYSEELKIHFRVVTITGQCKG